MTQDPQNPYQEPGQTPPEEPAQPQPAEGAGGAEPPAPAEAAPAAPPAKDECTMAMLAHLLGLVGFIGPLIIWLIKKDESRFVDQEGKESVNFQITLLIGYVISGITAWVCIGVFLGIAIWIIQLVFCIMAGMKANKGQGYRYPICIRFIK